MIKRNFRGIIRLMLLVSRTNFSCLKTKSKHADFIIWVWPSRNYFYSDNIVKDLGFISALSDRGLSSHIYFGKKVGKFYGRNIITSYNRRINEFGLASDTHLFVSILNQLVTQGNRVYPDPKEAALWENKVFMHKKFEELNINTPKTDLIDSYTFERENELEYPYLIKEEHSYSSNGLHLIKNESDLTKILDRDFFKKNRIVIAQELIEMRRDLRVILVGDEIVLHYWRINKSKNWKPTATGYGSDVDFVNFPKKWENKIKDIFRSLNLTTGAFDITWKNDDINGDPIVLEVSPNYQPNPQNTLPLKSYYGKFKKQISWSKNSYDYLFIKLVFEIQNKILSNLIEKSCFYKH